MRIKILLSALFILLFTTMANAELVDKIVAIVNNDIITLSDLNNEGKSYFQAIIHKAPTDRLKAALTKAKKEVLSHMVDQLLLEQEAAKIGIEVTKEDIDNAITDILRNNHITMQKFRADLKAMGTTEAQYRKKIKQQILRSRLVSYEIRSKIVIPEAQIKAYYKKNYQNKPNNSKGYHILQIGITWGEGSRVKTQAEALEKAKYVKAKLEAGGNFKELARYFSNLPSAADGGDIGVFKKSDLAPYMEKTIVNMRVGQISQIIATPSGYQIFKLTNAPGQKPQTLSAVHDEIKNILYKQEEEKEYQKWFSSLRRKAFIKYNP